MSHFADLGETDIDSSSTFIISRTTGVVDDRTNKYADDSDLSADVASVGMVDAEDGGSVVGLILFAI